MDEEKIKVQQAIIENVDFDQVYEGCMSLRAAIDMLQTAAGEFNKAGRGVNIAAGAQILAAKARELLMDAAGVYEVDVNTQSESEKVMLQMQK